MPRAKKTIPTVWMNIGIPQDLAARMKLELYSETDMRIPFGAQQEFFTNLLREYFKRQDGQKALNVEISQGSVLPDVQY